MELAMLKYMGYAQFEGINCILYQDVDGIRLIPANPNDKIIKYIGKSDFIFTYKQSIYDSVFLIDKVEMCFDNSIKLIPKYNLILNRNSQIYGFEMYGGAIDDFFNPVSYFFTKAKNGETINDILYHKENVDVWKIKSESNDITVSLYYGNVLSNGIGSDMMIHPKLNVRFSHAESNTEFIYKIYSIIIRFLQIIRFDLCYGRCAVELTDQLGHFCGRFYDFHQYNSEYTEQLTENNYQYYKKHIGPLLQFAADNPSLPIAYFPKNTIRSGENDYTPEDLVAIFGAFEAEYDLLKDTYGKANNLQIKTIKSKLIANLDVCSKDAITDEEKSFLETAKSKILNIGNELGQTKKLQKVFDVLLPALQSSIGNILFYFDDGTIEKIISGDISMIAADLCAMRGKAAHGHYFNKLTKKQAQEIRFLEILAYSQLLKRAQLNNKEIEMIIGIIFRCNYKYQEIL